MILALDLGTTAGYALGGDEFPPRSGIIDCSLGDNERQGARFLRFYQRIQAIVSERGITSVYYERVDFAKTTRAAHIYGGFWAYLCGFAAYKDLPLVGINVGTLKKYATGKGNADKDLMMSCAQLRGWRPEDHNESDALWVLDYAINVLMKGKNDGN